MYFCAALVASREQFGSIAEALVTADEGKRLFALTSVRDGAVELAAVKA
jgi:hypothetical protein